MICPACGIAISDEPSGFHHCKYSWIKVTYPQFKIVQDALFEYLCSLEDEKSNNSEKYIEVNKLIQEIEEAGWN